MTLIAALSGTARAADAVQCRNGNFLMQEATFGIASVIGAPRIYFRLDTPPCPDDSVRCRDRAYLVPGDTVVTGAASGRYVCVYFPIRYGGGAGYVRRDEFKSLPLPASVPLAAWTGTWRDGDDSIVLRAAAGTLTASGEAYWPSAHPPPKLRPGGPNVGDMSGTAAPNGNTVVFGDNDPAECKVTLTLLPPFLLAIDNKNCGGMNVSFTGVYRKR